MKKKLLSLALALMLALTLLPTAAFAEGDVIDAPAGDPVIEDIVTDPDKKPEDSDTPSGTIPAPDGEEKKDPAPADEPKQEIVTGPVDNAALSTVNEVTQPAAPQADTNTHTLAREVEAVAPTCTKTGSIKYYTCATCSEIFSDRALTQKITGSISVPALDHNYSNGYCTRCRAKDPDATHTHTHSLTHVAAVAATCTKAGSQEYWECVCGKRFATNNLNGLRSPSLKSSSVPWVTSSPTAASRLSALRSTPIPVPVPAAERPFGRAMSGTRTERAPSAALSCPAPPAPAPATAPWTSPASI